jgi:hypothetical protein
MKKLLHFIGCHFWTEPVGLIDFLGDTWGVCVCEFAPKCKQGKLIKAERE